MKKKILCMILLVIVAVIVCAFIIEFYKGRNNSDEVVLSSSDSKYKWECKFEEEGIATIYREYSKEVDYAEGSGKITHFVIKGKKSGNTKFTCLYVEEKTGYVYDSSIYTIKVDKKNNVTVENSN